MPIFSPSPTPEIPHTLFGSFYDVENFPSANLLLNNKDTVAREVRPTLYSLDGQTLELPPVQVEAQSFRLINLREWTDFGGNNFRQGSIELFHTGKDLVLGTQIYLEDAMQSLSFEEKLSEIGTFDSSRLEGVWFQPSNQTKTTIVLTNTSEDVLIVSAKLSRRPHISSAPQTFILQPHQVRLVDLRETFGNAFANSDALGISLSHNGAESALLARAMVSEIAKGYSTVVTFSNPNRAKSNELHGAGLQIGLTGGENLTPILVLRNTDDEETTVQVRLPYTRFNGTNDIINLSDINLRGNEIKKIVLNEISQIAGQITVAGIEIKYQAADGSVIAQMQSISQSRKNSFRVLLWDAPAQKSATGGYPWLIEGNSSTKAYIKNVTDKEQDYVSYLTWKNGGMYMIGIRQLAPHQTVEIDVRKLRDEQTPDEEDRTIPLEISQGQIQWSLKRREKSVQEALANRVPLVGQMEQIDIVNGVSTSYFCQSCCEDNYSFGYILPGDREVDNGTIIQYDAYEEGTNCYSGRYITSVTNLAQWSSSNQNVATLSNPGRFTTIGVGETTIKATFSITEHYVEPPCDGGGIYSPKIDGDSITTEKSVKKVKREIIPDRPAPCSCVCYGRSISPSSKLTVKTGIQKIQYQEPNTSNFIDITNTLYILKGTAVTFKAIPNPANATFPSGQPTWSGTSGATGSGQSISVTFNTTSSSTSDYKTVIANNGGMPVTVNVVVYELTGILMPIDDFTGRSLTNFGLKEIINLSYTSMPSITASNLGGLRWTLQTGMGQLTSQDDGTGNFTAPDSAESSTLKLEILSGPSKGQYIQKIITIVSPSNGYLVKTTNIARNTGAFGGAFKGNIYLEAV